MQYYNNDNMNIQLKEDNSTVTSADLASNGVTGVKFLIDGNQVKTRLVCGGGVVTATTIISGGSNYNDGTYTDVPTAELADAAGATLDITVAGGIITSATVNQGGAGYISGDVLTPSTDEIGEGNNDLEITVNTVTAAGADIILTGTGSNLLKKYNFIPLHNATEALVPVIQMNTADDFITIDHLSIYTDTNMNAWKYPSSANTNLDGLYRPIGGIDELIAGSDWYSQAENVTGDKLNFNARRPSIAWQIPGSAGGAGSLQYSNTGGGTYISDYYPVLVLGEEERDATFQYYEDIAPQYNELGGFQQGFDDVHSIAYEAWKQVNRTDDENKNAWMEREVEEWGGLVGFTDSIVRYQNLRKNFPSVEVMMGIGNLTELTHADTAGMNALLFGITSELNIKSSTAISIEAATSE